MDVKITSYSSLQLYPTSDLLKICCLKDPIEADPHWPFMVRSRKYRKKSIVAEFHTLNGRRSASSAFLLALVFRDLISHYRKSGGTNLTEIEVHVDGMKMNKRLKSALLKAVKLLNNENNLSLNLLFL